MRLDEGDKILNRVAAAVKKAFANPGVPTFTGYRYNPTTDILECL